MKVSIELSAAQAQRLEAEASRLGVQPEQLARAAVADLLDREQNDFEAAAARGCGRTRSFTGALRDALSHARRGCGAASACIE